MIEKRLVARGVRAAFGAVEVAQWRSLGDFRADLFDLARHATRRDEAISDVAAAIRGVAAPASRGVVVVGHSMGQSLAVMALASLRNQLCPVSLLTLGGPMGNSWARPYFHWMPQTLWADDPARSLGVGQWIDMWNPDDPVCGWHTYTAFRAARPQRFSFPGTPGLLDPFAEHGAYFDGRDTFVTLAKMVAALDSATPAR